MRETPISRAGWIVSKEAGVNQETHSECSLETEPRCSNSNGVHHSHFRGKETEAQRGRITSLQSHSKKWQSQDLNLGHWIWNPCF